MDPQQEFVEYIQMHPEYYAVVQAPVFMRLLSLLAKEGLAMRDLCASLPKIEPADLELMVKSLISIGLVAELQTDERRIYYVTEQGRKLLEMYGKTSHTLKFS